MDDMCAMRGANTTQPIVDDKGGYYVIQMDAPASGNYQIGNSWTGFEHRDSYDQYKNVRRAFIVNDFFWMQYIYFLQMF